MGVDTKIYLENHANVEKVYDVIARTLGAELKKYSSKGLSNLDVDEPSWNGNDWNVSVIHDSRNGFKYVRPTYFDLTLYDVCGQHYHTLFFYDVDDNEYAQNGERLLNPNASGVWLAIGKKLVDFFGGKMLISDADSWEDPNNWYVKEEGTYSKKINHCDDRWYAYVNALDKTLPLSKEDLLEFKDKCAYWNEREDTLLAQLPKITSYNKLSKELNDKEKTQPKKMKV